MSFQKTFYVYVDGKVDVGIRNCKLFGHSGGRFSLNPVLSRVVDSTAWSVYASLKLDGVNSDTFTESVCIKWLHLISDEHIANFRTKKLAESLFSMNPKLFIAGYGILRRYYRDYNHKIKGLL